MRFARLALLSCLMLGAAAALAPPAALAQAGTKAYAPDDLRRLSPRDQARVIEKEYAEQSGGRRIADDQLEFYLDQINASDWRFSDIQNDIARSLQGNRRDRRDRGGYDHGPVGGYAVVCESRSNRYTECPRPDGGRHVVLVRQISGSACVEGRTWGTRGDTLWVDRGCRGEFAAEHGDWRRPGRSSDYSVTCASEDNRYRRCAWNRGQGVPVLIETISRQACIEGRTWGYDREGLWVDRGCRGRFGAR